MRISFSAKTLLFVFLALILSGLPFVILLSHIHRQGVEKGVEQNIRSLSRVLTRQLERFMQMDHPALTQDYLLDLVAHTEIQTVTIFRKDGKAIFSSNPLYIQRFLAKDDPACQNCHSVSPPLTTATFHKKGNPSFISYVSVIANRQACQGCHKSSEKYIGFLQLTMPLSSVQKETRRSLFSLLIVGAWMLLTTVLVLTFLLKKRVVEPVEALAHYARSLQVDPHQPPPRELQKEELFLQLAKGMKETTEALREDELFLQAILDNLEEEIVVVDESRKVLLANKAFFARTPEEKRIPFCRREEKECLAVQALREGKPIRSIEKDGHKRYLLYIHPILFRGKRVALEVRQDVSVVESLAQSERWATFGLLAAGIAHLINSPLNVLTANLEVLKRKKILPLEVEERLDKACKRLTEVGNRMRLLSQSQKDQPHPLLLQEVIQRCVHFIEPLRKQYGVTIEVQSNLNHQTYLARASELEQIVLNLLVNGIQAMKKGGGVLRVRANYAVDEGFTLEVEDAGEGIPPENRAHIFEPTFSTKGTEGTGLGLFLVRHFVERYGGEIRVNSQPGKTVFTVTLPERHG